MEEDQATLNAKLGGSCALYAVAMIFIGLRIFSRLYLFGPLDVDDWLMVTTAIAYTGSMIMEILAWIEFKDLNVVQYIKSVFSISFAAIVTMWLIKFSVWFFIRRLIHGKWMSFAAKIVFLVLILTFITSNVFNLTWCAPIQSTWGFSPDGCLDRLEPIMIVDCMLSIFADILLLVLPLPLIWKVQLPLSTKLSLTGLFSLGFLAIAAMIISTYRGLQKDFISGVNFTIWCNVSLTTATAVACAPQIRAFFLKRFKLFASQCEAAQTNLGAIQDRTLQRSERSNRASQQDRNTSLTLSETILSGNGRMVVGDLRLSKCTNGEHEIV